MNSTKGKTQVVTNTQIAIATLALFLAGGFAFATIPLVKKDIKQKIVNIVSSPSKVPTTVEKNNFLRPINSLSDINLNNRPITIRTVLCITRWTQESSLIDESIIQARMAEINNYYHEVLFGKVNFLLSDIVTSSIWNSQVYGPTGEFWQDRTLAVQMCDSAIDYRNFDLVMFYPALQELSHGTKPDIQTEEGNFPKSIIQLSPDAFYRMGPAIHEIGHAVFRLAHSSRVECGPETYRENYRDCAVIDYGNQFDAMGSQVTGHFGGWNKYLAGKIFGKDWIRKQDVQSDGDYVLQALELPTTGVQLLRIPYRSHPICIEYRKPVGIDGDLRDQLAGDAFGSLDSIPDQGGILLNFCYTDEIPERNLPFLHLLYGAAVLLDPSPHLTNNLNDQERDNADIFLKKEVDFSNEALGIGIHWEKGVDNNTINVHLDIDENRL